MTEVKFNLNRSMTPQRINKVIIFLRNVFCGQIIRKQVKQKLAKLISIMSVLTPFKMSVLDVKQYYS